MRARTVATRKTIRRARAICYYAILYILMLCGIKKKKILIMKENNNLCIYFANATILCFTICTTLPIGEMISTFLKSSTMLIIFTFSRAFYAH